MQCDQIIQQGNMTEPRPCIRDAKHPSGHTPNLTGMTFGNLTVLKLGKPYIQSSGSKKTTWIVKNILNNKEKRVGASNLIYGKTLGRQSGFTMCQGKTLPEYMTVNSHWHAISRSKKPEHKNYKDMPFYSDWNPRKGGHLWKGAKWIIENLGQKPGSNWSLDIIEHAKGFVPGNLRWAKFSVQSRNKKHRSLGRFSLEELQTEIRRHGYNIVKK